MKEKRLLGGFHCCTPTHIPPLLTGGKWHITSYKLAHTRYISQFLSFFLLRLCSSIPATWFCFCASSVSLLFPHWHCSTQSLTRNLVNPFIHEQHIPSLHATLNQRFPDTDPMFPWTFPQPLLIPGQVYGALLLGQSSHPFPYCDPPQQFKDKPESPKYSWFSLKAKSAVNLFRMFRLLPW